MRIQSAPPERFFHFLWGYLLPAISWYEFERDRHVPARCVFRSCGPVMDVLTKEVCTCLAIAYRIEASGPAHEAVSTIRLPRWDLILKFLSSGDALPQHRVREFEQTVLSGFNVDDRQGILEYMKAHATRVRHLLLKAFGAIELPEQLQELRGKLLVLDRPEAPLYYQVNGSDGPLGYGKSKRHLANPGECLQILKGLGFDAALFKPADHSYAEQALVYKRASGLFGIRGAEFANMHFMQPGSMALLIDVASFKQPSPCRAIAEMFALDYVETEALADDFPAIQPDQVARWMKTSRMVRS